MSKITNTVNKASLNELSVQNTSDTLDIGFVGTYNDGIEKYTGLFRDATNATYNLFSGLEERPLSGVINTAGTGYELADLEIKNLNNNGYIQLTDITAPLNPIDGEGRLYKKTGDSGIFWLPDSAGTEVNINGDIQGPNTSVNNTIPIFSGTTGKLLTTTNVTINASDRITAPLMSLIGTAGGNLLDIQNNQDGGNFLYLKSTNGNNLVQFNKNTSNSLIFRINDDITGDSGFYYRDGRLRLGADSSNSRTYTLNIAIGDINLEEAGSAYRILGIPIDLGDLNTVALGALTSGDAIIYDGTNWVNTPSSKCCDLYTDELTTPTALSPAGTWIDIPLNVQRIIDSTHFTHDTVNTNPEVTINTTGRYELTYRVSVSLASTNTLSVIQSRFSLKPLGANVFTEVTGSFSYYSFYKDNNTANGTMTASIILDLDDGDIIKIQGITVSGDTVTVVSQATSLLIKKV
jgi:hypothetical protein